MSRQPVPRPASDEVPAYAGTYVQCAADALERLHLADLHALLVRQPADLAALLSGVSEAQGQSTYAPGKWTLAESLVHVVDTERVFAYRLLRAARADRTLLPGFDQDAWVPYSGASSRTLPSIITEFGAVRATTLQLLDPLDQNALARRAATGGGDVSARGFAWMIAGHAQHHLHLTAERYLARAG
jgi:hypothetical protein